jgi:hypothetical protein
LAAQVERCVAQGGVDRGGVGIGGRQRRVAPVAQAAQELADRTGNQPQGGGDLVGRLAALKALPDGAANREGRRCRHGKTSGSKGECEHGGLEHSLLYSVAKLVSQLTAQLRVAIDGKTGCRVTALAALQISKIEVFRYTDDRAGDGVRLQPPEC